MIEIKEKDYQVFCPICDDTFKGSDYLFSIFKEDYKVLWFSNMVTHYRHEHITSWNKCWGYGGGYYRYGWFGDYEKEKIKVNERAKRQILRKCKSFLIQNNFSIENIKKLQNNDKKTLDLAEKLLYIEKAQIEFNI